MCWPPQAGRLAAGCPALAILAVLGSAPSAVAQKASPPALERIDRGRLCVTNGVVSPLAGGQLAIETPSSRAIVQRNLAGAASCSPPFLLAFRRSSRIKLHPVRVRLEGSLMSVAGVRRAKAALSSGCKPHPANAPAGSNRSSYGGVAEAFG
jgi:hypothetical protein